MRNIAQPDSTVALLIEEDMRMMLAHQIAEASSCLDWLRSATASAQSQNEAKDEAPLHVLNLQRIATELAGDRVQEIYATDVEIESDIDQKLRFA